jgi:hypothetical protein
MVQLNVRFCYRKSLKKRYIYSRCSAVQKTDPRLAENWAIDLVFVNKLFRNS